MAAIPYSVVKWPGVSGVESCRGSLVHGITPSTFVLATVPQYARPEASGDLVIGDGERAVTLRDCRVSRVTGIAGPEGQTFTIEILDRRWRWRSTNNGFGAVDGVYNDIDDRGKLVPRTIRSPEELAILCLEAMGERDYTIDLPPGLPRAAGADLERYLQLGENFAQSLANPRTAWNRQPPAVALANLCDLYGRRVVLQVVTNRVAIVPLGVGANLPDLPSELISPSVKIPGIPSVIGVAGNLTFQVRLALEPVGLDWANQVLPIDQLSYAPTQFPGQKQVSVLSTAGPIDPLSFTVTLETSSTLTNDEVVFKYKPTAGTNVAQHVEIANVINNHPIFKQVVKATALGRNTTVSALENGFAFNFWGQLVFPAAQGANNRVKSEVIVLAKPGGKTWRYCPPQNFPGVNATERLAYQEARAMAQKCIWRYYRILAVDPSTGVPPLRLPQFGEIKRRQQIILEPSKVEQVVPTAPDPTGVQQFPVVDRVLSEYYDGYSSAQKPTIRGSIFRAGNGNVIWNGAGLLAFNQLPTERVAVGFVIDPVRQLVIFDSPVFRMAGGGWDKPYLVLETAVSVRDAETNHIVRWFASTSLGGDGPSEWQVRDDLQVGVIGKYTKKNKLFGTTFFDEVDAKKRAAFYMTGMTLKYQLPASETRQYAGIVPLNLDGRIQQTTWIVNLGGTTTIASSDAEYSDHLPDYPARRRAENLDPNAAADIANRADPKTDSPGKAFGFGF